MTFEFLPGGANLKRIDLQRKDKTTRRDDEAFPPGNSDNQRL
ncbi:MAG TPA: hypothetical protein V6C97_26965 [Oculatellaceae cyanobacterium]